MANSEIPDSSPSEAQFFYQLDPTESERLDELERTHKEAMLLQVGQAVETMSEGFEDLSEDERYQRLRTFISVRKEQWYDHGSDGDPSLGSLAAFNAYRSLSTDSVFSKRLIEWGMIREAHMLLEDSPYFIPDEAESDPKAWAEYESQEFFDPAPEGVKYRLSDEGMRDIQQSPDMTALLQFGLEQMNKNPQFGNSDFDAFFHS